MKFLLLPLGSTLIFVLAGCSFNPKVMSQRYVNKGNSYYQRGRFREASIMYRKALQKDLRSAQAWYRLGLTDDQLKRYREARRDLMRALDLDPNNLDAYVKLGDLNLTAYWVDPEGNEGALIDAQDAISKLEKRDPSGFDTLRLAGFLALYQHDYKEAIDKLKQASLLKPDRADVSFALVQCFYLDNQPATAEKYGLELIERDKSYAPIYDLLAQKYMQANRPEQAEAILKRKIANNPSVGAFAVQLASFYTMSGRHADAERILTNLASDSSIPDRHMLAGDFYLQTGDIDRALGEYAAGRKADSKAAREYDRRIAQARILQGKDEEAARVLSRLLSENPNDSEALAMRSTLVLKTGDRGQIDGVIRDLNRSVQQKPGDSMLRFTLARAYIAQGTREALDQAHAQLSEAVRLTPPFVPARLALAEVELREGNAGQAAQTCEDLLHFDRKNLGAMLLRSTALVRAGDAGKARTQLEAALAMYPASLDAHYDLAVLDLAEQRVADANAEFERLRGAGDVRGALGLAQVDLRLGRTADALRTLRSELDRKPNQPDVLKALAEVEYLAGDYKEAEAEFQRIANASPHDGEPMLHLGEARLAMHDTAGAIAAFSKAHELSPQDPLPLLQLGMVYEMNGSREQSQKMFESALKLDPNNAVALNALAFQKADDGVDLDQALSYAQRAQQQKPDSVDFMDTLALVYIRKNFTDDGVNLLRQVVNRDPNRAVFHLHLAMAYFQKGDVTDARKQLEAATRDRPTDKEREKIQQLMAKLG